jgi:mono/diheme cytochrome c family protein
MQDLFEVLTGPDAGARRGAVGPEAVIGRDPSCDIVVDDPQVSRRHARVWPWGDGFAIEDLGSTGGTSVNGVALTQATALAPGDVVRIGKTELRVLVAVPVAETAAAPIVPEASEPVVAPVETPPPDRRRLIAIPVILFVGISLAVFLIARAQPLERESPGGAGSAPVAAGDATRGQAAFGQTCAGCHGANAEGGVGPTLAGAAITVDQAVSVIRQGRGVMPAGLVSGQTEADVAAYLATILGSPPIPAAPAPPVASPPAAPPAPATPAPAPPPPASADATRGATVFANTCSGCHGAQAQGGVGPPLAGNPIGVEGATTVIRQGRGGMPAGLVSGQDEADLIAFLTTVLAP